MDIFSFFITIIVIAVLGYVLFWLINYIGVPDPFRKVLVALLVIGIVLYLLAILTGNTGPLTFG